MKLTDVVPQEKEQLEESYMKMLNIPMPIFANKPGMAAMLSDLSGEQVKEIKLGAGIYLVYTGKRPDRKDIAGRIQRRFNISFEKALSMVSVK